MIIERLVGWMDTASAQEREKAVDALVRAWHLSPLEDGDLDAAEAAMTCVLDDPDESVRIAFSRALSEIPNPPRHLVIALAHDTPMVSVPILVSARELMDAELIHILRNGSPEQEMAIACRPAITPAVTTAIATHAGEGACLIMVTNPASRPCETDFQQIAERHGGDEDIRKCLLARDDIGVRARLLLIEHYALSLIDDPDPEQEIDERAREKKRAELIEVCDKATITFAAQVSEVEIREVVLALIEREKLTTAFLLRAICMGNLSLFAHALCVLSGQSLARVEQVLQKDRGTAFTAIYSKAGLPASAMGVFQTTIRIWRECLVHGLEQDEARLPYHVTRQVIASYEGRRDGVVDELMMLLRRICTDAARDSARTRVEQLALEGDAPMLALPAPQDQPEVPELSEEELAQFAYQFADELAEQALRDEAELETVSQNLEVANEPDGAAMAGLARSSSSLWTGGRAPVVGEREVRAA